MPVTTTLAAKEFASVEKYTASSFTAKQTSQSTGRAGPTRASVGDVEVMADYLIPPSRSFQIR